MYTNLARRFAGAGQGVALYELATDALFLALRLGLGETSRWAPELSWPLAHQILAIGALAYALWEHGVRRGSLVTLSAAAYALPVAATIFSCLYLDEPATPGLLLGSVLVVIGALLCRAGVQESGRAGKRGVKET